MHALQDQVFGGVDGRDAFLGWGAPSEEDDALGALFRDRVDDLLRKTLPAFASVGIGFVRTHSQACVEHEHAAVCPRREQAAFLWWWLKVGIVFLQGYVDVL